ncbi:MAG: MBOAT family O-acyltransferase [Alphaproteobacteria bacterium]
MIPGLEPIAPNTIVYLALASGLVLLAWSPRRDIFLAALALAGVAMAISWLGPRDLLALAAFQVAPYMAIRRLWGKKQAAAGQMASAVIVFQILLFLVFKRYAWFDVLGTLDLAVSIIGISYILFRQIHLLIEAPYLGHLPFSLGRYVAFTLSPWTLIAGPIQRYDGFCKGLNEVGRPANDAVLAALHRTASGLIKAFVLAPLLLPSTDIALLLRADANGFDFAVVLYSFPIYLYLNFSGYVDVVIGIARLCGFTTLPENFNRPYLARNVRDFWTRWHMSFGIWVRHYVFTPLSTFLIRRVPANMAGLMMALTVMVTFYLVGVWHGTTLNFVAFGLLQGAGVLVSASFERFLRGLLGKPGLKRLDDNKLFHAASIFITLNFTAASILLLENQPADLAHTFQTFFFNL